MFCMDCMRVRLCICVFGVCILSFQYIHTYIVWVVSLGGLYIYNFVQKYLPTSPPPSTQIFSLLEKQGKMGEAALFYSQCLQRSPGADIEYSRYISSMDEAQRVKFYAYLKEDPSIDRMAYQAEMAMESMLHNTS